MNKIISKITVLAIVGISIALLVMGALIDAKAAHGQENQNFMPYGSIAQEDELYTVHNGSIYVNTVYEDNSGNFRLITDLETEYTVDEAIDRFKGIHEDSFQFTVQKEWSDVKLIYQFNEETLTFQLLTAIEA